MLPLVITFKAGVELIVSEEDSSSQNVAGRDVRSAALSKMEERGPLERVTS